VTSLYKAGILTVSDRSFRGEREDKSGPLLTPLVEAAGCECSIYKIVPDEKSAIQEALLEMSESCDLVLTAGGTGLALRDVTPEATREILEREILGIPEALRAAGMQHKPTAMLSRGLAGTRGKCLIVNLPGSPGAIQDAFQVLKPILRHAVQLLKGEVNDCQKSLSLSHSHS
jgi:molybdopterin adenylyltransferase